MYEEDWDTPKDEWDKTQPEWDKTSSDWDKIPPEWEEPKADWAKSQEDWDQPRADWNKPQGEMEQPQHQPRGEWERRAVEEEAAAPGGEAPRGRTFGGRGRGFLVADELRETRRLGGRLYEEATAKGRDLRRAETRPPVARWDAGDSDRAKVVEKASAQQPDSTTWEEAKPSEPRRSYTTPRREYDDEPRRTYLRESTADEATGDTEERKVAPYIPPDAPDDEELLFSGGIERGVNFENYDLIEVKVTGENIPEKIERFEDAGLCPLVMSNIRRNDYVKPTPVQKYAIPSILAGRDLMACAQSGSGKTASFLIPFIHLLLEDPELTRSRRGKVAGPQLLVVGPTRELVVQTYVEAKKFAFGTSLKVERAYGGTSLSHQKYRLQREGCNILIATPGRLLDFLNSCIGLSQTRYLVIDEADWMFDSFFVDEMERILNNPTMDRDSLQVVMFSATFPPEIQRSASTMLKNYLFLTVGIVGGACVDVEQSFIEIDKHEKRARLMKLLEQYGSKRIIVFVQGKRTADIIATYLSEKGIPATSMHGARDQKLREEALDDFKSGRMGVLVATAVAARGLNINNVTHVINFELPRTIDEYVHRIGRTGRVGNKGRATSFYCEAFDAPLAPKLVWILKQVGQEVPQFLLRASYSARRHEGAMFGDYDVRADWDDPPALRADPTEADEVW